MQPRMRPGRPVAALLVAIVVSSCSSSEPEATPSTVPLESTIPPAPTTVPGPSMEELEARLVTVVPAGFEQQDDSVGDTGPSDLAKAVRDDDDPRAEQVLRSEGFVRGYQRLWIGPDDAEIIVFLYEFQTATGANADYERAKASLSDQTPPGATSFTVRGIPANKSTSVAAASDDGTAAVVLFTTGVFNVQVVCSGPRLTGLQARVSAIARDQYSRL